MIEVNVIAQIKITESFSFYRFTNAMKTCSELNVITAYEKLAVECLKALEIEFGEFMLFHI